MEELPASCRLSNRLCGVNATYTLLKLENRAVRYADILRAFPEAKTEGLSLAQIGAFLETLGVRSHVAFASERELVSRGESHPVLVLNHEGGTYHLVAKKIENGAVKTYDDYSCMIRSRDFAEDRHLTLFVGPAAAEGGVVFTPLFGLAAGAILVAGFHRRIFG